MLTAVMTGAGGRPLFLETVMFRDGLILVFCIGVTLELSGQAAGI